MRDVKLIIPEQVAEFLRSTIRKASGNEVYFLGRLSWDEARTCATLDEVDVLARGNRVSVLAIVERAEDWDIAIHNHPSGRLEPSAADMAVAGELSSRRVGFAIISNAADRHYLVVTPFVREEARRIDLDEVRELFGPKGPIAAAMTAARGGGNFEPREGQLEMALEVAAALNDGRVVACEAGTGVGKSFAYLVPSILWATRNRERVVVSTGTINLQEQLVAKDLPFLEKALPVKFQYALIKGRGNYACRRKLSELPHELEMLPADPGEQRMLEELIAWGAVTGDGSRADLNWTPPAAIWERVMSETDRSLKAACPFYGECFYYEAKRRASSSQIVVANHHLFLSDLALRRESGDFNFDLVLPGYRRVVLDEAHHLEDVASEHLGVRFSRLGIRLRLAHMCSPSGRGHLITVIRKLASHGDPVAAEALDRGYASAFPEIAEAIDEEFQEIEERLAAERLPDSGRENGNRELENGAEGLKLRFKPRLPVMPLWEALRERLGRTRGELQRLARLNDAGLESLRRSVVDEEQLPGLALELESFGGRLGGLITSIDRFLDYSDTAEARWIETEGSGARRTLAFAAAPIEVAEALQSALYAPLKSVVMTSATLSVAGDARFLGERLGFSLLPPERFRFRMLPSPFNYAEQVLTVVPVDLPAPGSPGFAARLPAVVLDLLRASGGRAFVLFTSYQLLRRTHAALEGELRRLGFSPLAQGEAQRSELLKRFKESGNGVLFGTDSFWEGVDVKGEALGCVILTRLPFRVPSEPLQEARVEHLAGRGQNPFTSFTVPQAVLRFKQGFGRLIRSAEDRGVVAVLDQRLLSRPYGKVFLASLPPTAFYSGPTPQVVARVAEFFKAQAAGATAPEAASPSAASGEPPW